MMNIPRVPSYTEHLPTIANLSEFKMSYYYKNNQEKLRVIKDVALAVSEIYAYFLTSDVYKDRVVEIHKNKPLKARNIIRFPSENEIEMFQQILERTIEIMLLHSKENEISLTTQGTPIGLLHGALSCAKIVQEKHDVNFLFPKNSIINIRLMKEKRRKFVDLYIDFNRPLFKFIEQ